MAHAPTNDDALPRLGAKSSGDDRLNVVAAIEAEQAELSPKTVLDESGPSGLDAVCHRLGSQGPGTRYGSNPITSTRGDRAIASTFAGYVVNALSSMSGDSR